MSEEIRFDTAAAAPPAAPACGSCGQPIATTYHEINGAVICPGCRAALESQASAGSASGRFATAAAYGLGAAAVGAGLYYAVVALTGYEIGLIAIAVGWLVGRAVQLGSRSRGGWAYQGLAVVLTYLAIVTTYVPYILESVDQGALAGTAGSLVVLVVAVAAPFLAGPENILGLLIIGFALYQAWRMNARAPLVFTGPYALGTPRVPADA
jgi:hypothetical protein